MTREQVASWIAAYERAWRTPGTSALAGLFTEDATYQQAPYDDPVRGRHAIAAMWERERDGSAEVFTMTSDTVAVEGSTAVARVEIRYGEPVTQEFRDLWIISFAADGLCRAFEEWPFWPDETRAAQAG